MGGVVGDVSVDMEMAFVGGGWTSRNTGRSHSGFDDVDAGDMDRITATR